MSTLNRRLFVIGLCALTTACTTTRPLPKYEPPLSRAAEQRVRTTAYTHTESDHLAYGRSSANGTELQSGEINSAAADWSRWPSGTVFRIAETGETYQVDDYGWALAGTNTIDLYKPTRASMNSWGVRRVNIQILRWGDVWRSRAILAPRNHYAHVRRMLSEIDGRYARHREAPAPVVADYSAPAPALTPPSGPEPAETPVSRTEMVSANPPAAPKPAAPLTPFYR